MRHYRGDFEVHVTVSAATEIVLDRFRGWCRDRGFKCVMIVLSRGDHVDQPMATWRRGSTELPAVVEEAEACAEDLRRREIPVARVKVEAAPMNAEVPVADADATAHEPLNYFEHHVKLLRKSDAPREALVGVCEQHQAHLSRNAFRQPEPGDEERFVTLRSYGVGRESSDKQLRNLLAALDRLGEHVIEHESEYCVYDSNLDLDAGWLPQTA